MDDPPTVVDVDDPSTWPPVVRERTQILADRLRGTTEYTNDLKIYSDDDDEFRALLSGYLVRVYHATRLLDHELQMIRAQGLRPLSSELVEERINAAFEHACISTEDRDLLHHSHVFASGEEQNRAGEISLFFPASRMANPTGINPLLGSWGGEAIGMSNNAAALPDRLLLLGKPSVVVANIDLSAGQSTHSVDPGTLKPFIGRLLNLERHGAQVMSPVPVPPRQIVAILQPGDAEYDQFEGLLSS